jgi:hypothetical protein
VFAKTSPATYAPSLKRKVGSDIDGESLKSMQVHPIVHISLLELTEKPAAKA